MKLKLKWIMIAETLIVIFTLAMLAVSNNPESIFAYIGAIVLVLLLLQSAYIPLYGMNFIIYEAPSDSVAKYYWFISIGIGVFLGTRLTGSFFEFSQRLLVL